MVTSIENRLWLAVHLLYSNASQAFDVYQAVVLQSEHAIANQDIAAVFTKLFQVYEKIPAISSNMAFYEFEFEEIDQWKIIYKNSQKTQLVIFVGVLIFELKISQIAPTLKLAPEKAQFLFHQIFKKLASSSQKLKYNEQLEFKKQNDNKISYLFTYENLVDFCLEQLNPEDTEKIKTGLKLYPTLQVAKEEYSRIISQIQNLKVQKERTSVVSPMRPQTKILKEVSGISSPTKGLTKLQLRALIVTFVVVVGALLIQPVKSFYSLSARTDNTVVLQEVEVSKPTSTETQVAEVSEVSQTTVAVNESETVSSTVAAVSTTTVAVNQIENKAAIVAAAPAPAPVQAPVATMPTPQPATAAVTVSKTTQVAATPVVAKPPVESAKTEWEGGLYRGTLLVKDIAALNANIKEKMLASGAVKAGEVELGWQKSPEMAYYHYTMPESNKAELETYLKKIGNLIIKFEKHPRKIPIGTRRFIIEVKQN